MSGGNTEMVKKEMKKELEERTRIKLKTNDKTNYYLKLGIAVHNILNIFMEEGKVIE